MSGEAARASVSKRRRPKPEVVGTGNLERSDQNPLCHNG